MQVESQTSAGGRVANLMRDAGAELAERAQPFVLSHVGLVASQPFDHVIDRTGQVLDFIVAASQGHRAEIALLDGCGLPPQDSSGRTTRRANSAVTSIAASTAAAPTNSSG